MSADKKGAGGYEVGYGKPPRQHRFPKGRSGNPLGRPKSKKRGKVDVSALLNEPVRVRSGDAEREMSPFEASVRQLASKAITRDIPAIRSFVRLCEEYRVITQPPADTGGGVVVAPKGVDFHEWFERVTEEVPIDED